MENINISRLFPGWRIVRKIGQGGYGTVYEIAKERLGETEKAALKVMSIPNESGVIDELRSEGYDDASFKKRFESDLGSFVKEYKNMRMLTHTNIVNCDDIEYEESADGVGYTMYIKMELLTPLMSVINKSTDVEKLALDLAKDICSALVLCESRNVVHRDIKPQNLFVNEYGEYKLGDFGIARQMDHTTNATRTGTYKYMAPEVYNNKPYGHNVDIYSLGLVLYWILNDKRLPFLPLPPAVPTAQQEEDARAKRIKGERLPAPKHGSTELKRIILKACEAHRDKRYQSAGEMLADLEAIGQASSKSGYKEQNPYDRNNNSVSDDDQTMGNSWGDNASTAGYNTSRSTTKNGREYCTPDKATARSNDENTRGNSWNDDGATAASFPKNGHEKKQTDYTRANTTFANVDENSKDEDKTVGANFDADNNSTNNLNINAFKSTGAGQKTSVNRREVSKKKTTKLIVIGVLAVLFVIFFFSYLLPTIQKNESTDNSSVQSTITTIDSYTVGQHAYHNVGVIQNAAQASWLYEDDAWSAYPCYLLKGVTIASDVTKDVDSPDGDYIFKVKIDNKKFEITISESDNEWLGKELREMNIGSQCDLICCTSLIKTINAEYKRTVCLSDINKY